MKTLENLDPETRRNLLLLLGTGFLFWTSITTLLPTLPIYIEDLGGTKSQVGWVMGSFAIGLLGSRTWLGYLADDHSRKIVVRIGALVAGIAPLGYLLSGSVAPLMAIFDVPVDDVLLPIPLSGSVVPLIAIRAFHGISVAAFTTGYSALVVDLSPLKQRGELLGYMSLVAPVGMGIGPALGGYLQESVGYPPLFLTTASLGFLGYFLAALIQEKPRHLVRKTASELLMEPSRSFWQLLRSHSLLVPSLVLLLIGLLFGALVTFLPLFLREANLGLNAGLFYMVAAIASFTARIFSGQASDRYGRGLFITISLLCYAASMGLLIQADSSQTLLLAAIFEGTGGGVLIPMIIALISDRSSSQERGRVYSVCISGFDVGIAIAGPILGLLAEVLSYRYVFALSGGLAVIALVLFLSQSNQTLKNSLRFALGQGKDLYALKRG